MKTYLLDAMDSAFLQHCFRINQDGRCEKNTVRASDEIPASIAS